MKPGSKVVAGDLQKWEIWLSQIPMNYEERDCEQNNFGWSAHIYVVKAIGSVQGRRVATIGNAEAGITKRVPVDCLVEYPG
jgi:hypothetical protein